MRLVWSIPRDAHDSILYPLALVRNGSERPGAAEFLRFLASPKARGIFARHGFETD